MSEQVLRLQGEYVARSLNEEKRQATFTASTENPVQTWEGPEVLRMTGARLQRFRKNPVVLDTHNRFGLDSVIGRADVKVQGRELVATITYAPTPSGERAWELVKGDFVRAVSIGYVVNRKKVRRLGENETDGEGESLVRGPATVAREWELLEISNVPVPADADAVRRSFYESIPTGEVMHESAISRGLNEGALPSSAGTTPAAAPSETKPTIPARQVEELPEERTARILRANREAALQITPRGLEHVTESALLDGKSLEQVREVLKKAQAERFKPVSTTEPTEIKNGEEERAAKSLPDHLTDDLIVRSFENLR